MTSRQQDREGHFGQAPAPLSGVEQEVFYLELAPLEKLSEPDARMTPEERSDAVKRSIEMADQLPEATEEDMEEIDVQAEAAPPRMIRTPMGPTPEEKEEHELTGHAVYRDWCAHCIAAKGVGQRHLIQSKGSEIEKPTVALDYAYMGDKEKVLPILVVKDNKYQTMHASFVDAKGPTEYATRFLANVFKLIGHKDILGWSDGEYAINKLKQRAAQAAEVNMIPREPTPGDHQGNGFIENAVKEIKKQCRVIRSDLEEKLGFSLKDSDPVLRWLPRYAADAITRYRKGLDGRTPERRRTGRAWNKPTIRFGERAYFRPVGEYTGSTYQPKMVEGRYLGHHTRTGACVAITKEGVIHASGIRRLPEDQKWIREGWSDLRGLPWDVKTRSKKDGEPTGEDSEIQGSDKPIAEGEDAKPLVLPMMLPAQIKEKETRGFYVLKADVDKYGPTGGCPGCAMVMITGKTHSEDGSVVPHNDTCRERMLRMMLEDSERKDRALAFQKRQRLAEVTKMKRQHPEENAAEAAGDSRKRVRATPKRLAQKRALEAAPAPLPGVEQETQKDDEEVRVVSQTGGSSGSGLQRMHIEDLVDTVPGAPAPSPGVVQTGETEIEMEVEETSRPAAQKRAARNQDPDAEDIDALEEIKAVMKEIREMDTKSVFDELKGEMLQETREAMELQFRRHRIDVDQEKLRDISQLALETGAVDVAELYSPERFRERAQDFGLRPGFAIDLQNGWDLNDGEHVEQVKYLIDEEDPMVLIGSPPCTIFTSLRKMSNNKRDPKTVEAEEREGKHHLKVACDCYKKQIMKGRLFLHEHPEGASSWNEDCIKEIRALHGKRDDRENPIEIFEVKGPMCHWNLKATERRTRKTGLVKKETRWMTNSSKLAELLNQTCANKLQESSKWHRHVQLVGGLAKQAQCYTPELVEAILKTIKAEMMTDNELSQLEAATSGPSPHEPEWFENKIVEEDFEDYFDTVNGGFLKPELVKQAREEELQWVNGQKIFDTTLISFEEAKERMNGVPPISVKWVDTNKGDDIRAKYRSRLVAREIKRLKKAHQQLEVKDLFSAMPPLEAMKVLVSLLMTTNQKEDLHLALFDISRAHFYGTPTREIYVILPKELNPEGLHGGRACAKLTKTMYGTQDASKIWQDEYKELLVKHGFQMGISNAAVFKGPKGEKALVHGDDFLILASQACIDAFEATLNEKFTLRKEWQIGFGTKDARSGRVLNRIITLESHPRRAIIEPDARHAQIIVKELGLEQAKAVETPAEKLSSDKQMADANAAPVGKHEEQLYRSIVMRASYLAQDSPDLSEAVKSLARYMKEPNQAHFSRLKRLGRFLKGHALLRNVMYPQETPNRLEVLEDSDHAGCAVTRKSTTGLAVMFGKHCIKHLSNLQSTIALSSGESEYYALVKAAQVGLGVKAMLEDLGVMTTLSIHSDSSAARGHVGRLGLGKMRHIQTRYLWVQERIRDGHFTVVCIKGKKNPADLLTKPLTGPERDRHLKRLGYEYGSPSDQQKGVLSGTGIG